MCPDRRLRLLLGVLTLAAADAVVADEADTEITLDTEDSRGVLDTERSRLGPRLDEAAVDVEEGDAAGEAAWHSNKILES